MAEQIITKTCTKCHANLPLSEYYKDDRGKYGRFAHCKDCHAEMQKQYRATPNGHETTNRLALKYRHSKKGEMYRQTRKYKDSQRRANAKYRKTQNGKAKATLIKMRYKATKKCKETRRRYYRKRYELKHIREDIKQRVALRKQLFPKKIRAVEAVAIAVRKKIIPKPTAFQCSCGEPAKLYHHHLGYEPKHWFDVVAICYSCHSKTHKTWLGGVLSRSS